MIEILSHEFSLQKTSSAMFNGWMRVFAAREIEVRNPAILRYLRRLSRQIVGRLDI
jgi:hypothetical protein